jgi:hypothetical protein
MVNYILTTNETERMALQNYSIYDVYEQFKQRDKRGKIRNAEFSRLSRNLRKMPSALIAAIKTYIGSYNEETESVYIGNGTIATQIETVPSVYSSYSSSMFKNQYNYNYDCVMESSIDKDSSLILSHRMNSKGTKHRYYIGKFNRDSHCDECMSAKCANKWYCLGITETIESYKTHFVGEDRELSIIMFWGILNEIKNNK